jgi:hypothetical protein
MQHRTRKRLIAIAAVFVLLFSFAPAVLGAGAAVDQAKIYVIAEGDNGESGELVGCGDSLIPVTRDIPSGLTTEGKIEALLDLLFSLKDPYYGQSGYYNAVYSSNLFVESVEIEGNTAAIYLSGQVSVGGVCDEPRVEGQITAIARQFAGITNAIVIFNGGSLFSNAGSIDFPLTGHSVEAPFFPYWEVQGGLPIFGYPLTDQFVQGGYRVQYFERQRLEHHPENQAPYNILFGLSGLETAERRGLTGTAPFGRKPALPAGDCEYFAETGHNVCGKFRTYWHSYGLDFGEPGFSARESLALFGFPISEPFQETLENGQTYTVQYFERVRMELHPENQAPYDVLLGRLTADLIPPGR